MSILFDAGEINGMKVSNRFVRAATWEGMAADDGGCTAKLTKLMVALAEGGVGLIISSHAFVSPEGQGGPWQLGIHRDELVPGLQSMTQAVHDRGAKLCCSWRMRAIFHLPSSPGRSPWHPQMSQGLPKGCAAR